MTLKDLIRVQEEIALETRRRFEKHVGLVFCDLVGSTAYLEEFGDLAGRALLETFRDLVRSAIIPHGGRIIDFAGDGAFCICTSAEKAVQSLIALHVDLQQRNAHRPPRQRVSVRSAAHFGPVLVDGDVVSGDAVHLTARIMSTGAGGSIRLSETAYNEMSADMKVRCARLEPTWLKGIPHEVTIFVFDWRDREVYPCAVRIEQTGQLITLPDKDRITMGRLREHEGHQANDIVLALDDVEATRSISRWHVEMTRGPAGALLKALSDAPTIVDGKALKKGEEVPIRAGTVVRLSGVITLVFTASTVPNPDGASATILVG